MSSREFTAWKAYDAVCSIDGTRDRVLMAQMLAMYANAHKAKGKAPAKPDDFLPNLWAKRKTPEDIERMAMAWARKYNANLKAR